MSYHMRWSRTICIYSGMRCCFSIRFPTVLAFTCNFSLPTMPLFASPQALARDRLRAVRPQAEQLYVAFASGDLAGAPQQGELAAWSSKMSAPSFAVAPPARLGEVGTWAALRSLRSGARLLRPCSCDGPHSCEAQQVTVDARLGSGQEHPYLWP